jgi:hypothetical protein
MEVQGLTLHQNPPELVAFKLNVSKRTLTQWRGELRKVLRESEFDWRNNEPFISAKSEDVLRKYQNLIAVKGKRKAKEHIKIYGV